MEWLFRLAFHRIEAQPLILVVEVKKAAIARIP
jgi:hypothetical protein